MVLGGPKTRTLHQSRVRKQLLPNTKEGEIGDENLLSVSHSHSSGDPKQQQSKAETEPDNWKTYLRLVLPHLGLVIMCIVYTFGGATVFYMLERPNEESTRRRSLKAIGNMKQKVLEDLWDEVERVGVGGWDEWKGVAVLGVDNITRVLFEAFEERYITFEHLLYNSTHNTWTFSTAVFFAATTITTVGYGNLVPMTKWGRIFCVFYGMFGIPLMLVTIADIGKFIGDGIVLFYHKYQRLEQKIKGLRLKKDVESKKIAEKELALVQAGDGHTVPTIWVILIIVGYTALGGVVFPYWERWTFYESFYFSFITMSTIGFGDYVPENKTFYLVTILYILLGLAISTMCVDLVGSEYIEKIHFFGRKIQNAREALKTVGDMMRYTTFLKRKYHITNAELKHVRIGQDWDEFMKEATAFTPKDINRFTYIDGSHTGKSGTSASSGTVVFDINLPKIDDNNANHIQIEEDFISA